ncbi:SDR family NAD(P)-dependent oxidoreductase [Halobaculum sp. EA56]|uniref:SDR family NAD(P)-dependent oxidoreductase n=1 Tax=Halobaculum sp. EA56 TaxID=3421648 RepID=UPI003EB82D23
MSSPATTADRTALVTGASSGIGAALAREIAMDQYDLVLTARREERLQNLAEELEATHGVTATVITQDLAAEKAGEELFEAVTNEGIEIHTLVNNAGVPLYGRFDETELEDERDIMEVNMVALTSLTKRFLRPMVKRGEGRILNTASMAALYPIPKKAVYSGTKSYVLSFSRALGHELDGSGVTVTAVCPGVVETEYANRGNVEKSNTLAGVTNDPRSVAQAAWEGAKDGERIVFPSLHSKYGSQLVRLLPRSKVTELGESTVEDGASWI